jgi:hypothetical protein
VKNERIGEGMEFLEGLALAEAEYAKVYEQNAAALGITA